MHKKLLIILSIFTLLLTNVKSDEIVIKQLKKGGNIVFIRHAIAPGGGIQKILDWMIVQLRGI